MPGLTRNMASSTSYTLRVPATSANLGPGYDSLGVAFRLHNTFRLTLLPHGQYRAHAEGPEAPELHLHPESNMVVKSFARGWALGGGNPTAMPGLDVHVDTHIPTTRGLGSSSTAVVAGVLTGYHAAAGSVKWPVLLEAMTALEGNPDNVLPATLGGVVCGAYEPGMLAFARRSVSSRLAALAYIPDAKLATKKAREALPQQLSHSDAVYNSARTPLVLEALVEGDLELLRWAMQDKLHQPYRRKLIDAWDLVEGFADQNRLPFALSGAGPTLLMWCLGEEADGLEAEFRAAYPQLMLAGQVKVLWPLENGISGSPWDEQPALPQRLTFEGVASGAAFS